MLNSYSDGRAGSFVIRLSFASCPGRAACGPAIFYPGCQTGKYSKKIFQYLLFKKLRLY